MKMVITLFAMAFISISAAAQVKTGQVAPEISLPGTKGETLSLSSFKGKVVLIDFWASWCAPCRKSIPQVVKLYEKLKGKGFVVLGVSIDSKKKDWLKAITDLKMTYPQVNDNKGWDASSTLAYGVEGIPATFLLDKEGKIVAIDPESAKLEEQVTDLLKQ